MQIINLPRTTEFFSEISPSVSPSLYSDCTAYLPATWLAQRFRDLMLSQQFPIEASVGEYDYTYGPYQIDADFLANQSISAAKAVVDFWRARSNEHSSNIPLFQARLMNDFLFSSSRAQLLNPAGYAATLAAGFVGAARPDLVRSLANQSDTYRTFEFTKYESPVPLTQRKFKNYLIDSSYGVKQYPERADPYFDISSIGLNQWDELIYRISLMSSAIAFYFSDPQRLSQAGYVKARVTPSMVGNGVTQGFYQWACSFDPNILVTPAKRTPAWILDSEAKTRENSAIAVAVQRAIAEAKSESVAEDARLYTYAQLQDAKNREIERCPLNDASAEKLSTLLEEAIRTRDLQTPTEVSRAVQKAVGEISAQKDREKAELETRIAALSESPKSNVPMILGVVAALGIGYYFLTKK